MKRLPTFLFAFTLALGMIALNGCDSAPSSDSTTGEGTVSVKFTDSGNESMSTAKNAHGEKTITSAVVTIGEVEIVAAEDTSEEDAEGRSVLSADSFEVDLIDLQDGVDQFLNENGSEISAGTYGQLRLITAEKVDVAFEDSTTTEVMIASGQETGLKVNFEPFTIESENDYAEITLDFDVQESLHGSPQGEWVITPVVDATATVNSDTTSSEN